MSLIGGLTPGSFGKAALIVEELGMIQVGALDQGGGAGYSVTARAGLQ
jgi:hypothetical protein